MSALLTPRQVAERLAISPRTVYLWIEQGRLPALRLSERVTRIPAEAVDALVEASSSGTPAATAVPLTVAEDRAGYASPAPVGLAEPEAACSPAAALLRALLADHREEILEIASRRRIDSVKVFGSVARGDAHPRSDVDLLVQLAPQASLFDLSGFAGEAEALLGVKVDVIDATNIRRSLRASTLAEAVPL